MLKLIYLIMQQKNCYVTRIDTSNLAANSDLGSLKTEVVKLDNVKLVSVPVDLNKLSEVVKNDLVDEIFSMN